MIVLETDRLLLRELTLEDIDGLHAVLGDPIAMAYYPSAKTRDETAGWIQWNVDSYGQNGFGLWGVVLKDANRFVGDCGITLQLVEGAHVCEIGYHIVRDYWGQGLATEAARACLAYGFETLGCHQLVSIVDPFNIASRTVASRVHDKLRFFRRNGEEMCLYCTERQAV